MIYTEMIKGVIVMVNVKVVKRKCGKGEKEEVMKKISSMFIAMLLVFNFSVIAYAIAPPYVESVEIEGEEVITMYVGDELTLKAISVPGGVDFAYMLWVCDTENIVDLVGDDGMTRFEPPISTATVKAVNVGTVIITVYSEAFEAPYPDEYTANDSVTINVLPKEEYPDEYVVKFYTDVQDENAEEPVDVYHQIENLKIDDIVVFPEMPEKEGYIFTGWKAQLDNGVYFTGSQPFNPLDNNGIYYASWCLEDEYKPITIDISSNEPIIKAKENGKKVTLKTNYGVFVKDSEFPTEWRTAYDAEVDEEVKSQIISDWKSKWNIVGSDELMVETATRIDDKTVELILSGNSSERYSDTNIYIEFDNSLLMPEPYELNDEVIDWDDTKIKTDADGVRAKMYRSDNAVTLLKQTKPTGGGSLGVARYTVMFETNGGNSLSKQTVNKNATIKEPDLPQKDGYNFGGWFIDEELTTRFDFQTKVTKNITLYAKWEIVDETKDQIIFTIGKTKATVFGKEKQNDVAPIIKGDRAFLPARFVAENLGAKVEWSNESRKVIITKGDTRIVITIDSETAIVNDEIIKLDYPAFIENDRTYTPIRFIAEMLQSTVEWEEDSRTITITK